MPRVVRRACRILVSLATLLSLLLCAATVALWARSHARTDHVVWRRADGARSLRTWPAPEEKRTKAS